MDTSKLDKILPYTFADISAIDVIITDKPLPKDITTTAEAAGVRIIVA